jgi:hypothetical protein
VDGFGNTRTTQPTGEIMVKGTARLKTNLKLMAGGSTPFDYLYIGDSCYGTEIATDIINITIVERVTGVITILAQPCKAYKANLIVTQNATPPGNPPPVEPPAEKERMIVQYSTDGGVTWITDADEIWERVS